jgi:hypothetical protein
VTWLKHRCWRCGFKHRAVELIPADQAFQCVDWESCTARHRGRMMRFGRRRLLLLGDE